MTVRSKMPLLLQEKGMEFVVLRSVPGRTKGNAYLAYPDHINSRGVPERTVALISGNRLSVYHKDATWGRVASVFPGRDVPSSFRVPEEALAVIRTSSRIVLRNLLGVITPTHLFSGGSISDLPLTDIRELFRILIKQGLLDDVWDNL
jgi:hypothetical protein